MQRLTAGAPVCLAVILGASSGMAQTPSPEDMASARILGTDGVRLADSGDCAGAVVKLEAAEKLFHAPTTLERLGECQVKVGQLVAGTESLNRVVRESLSSNAPAAFLTAKQRAQQALNAALPHIGKLRIHVDGAPADKVTVAVDGANVPSALFDADRPTDPGVHEVKATATGYKVATASVKVDDGGAASVSLKLEPDLNAAAALASPMPAATLAVPAASAPESPPPASSDGTGTRRGVAFGALGVGGAGIVVGTVFGIMALSTKSTLNGECGSAKNACPGPAQSDINALSTRATVSTIGFAVGIAGAGLGTVLLVTLPRAEKPAPSGAATRAGTRETAAVRFSPWIGLGSAGVGGTFE